jgi:hypothetical protein
MIEDGKSRVFLEVSQKVEITERKAQGRVVYRLAGASMATRNSRLPLLTSFFPTPVGQIVLVTQGGDTDLVIDLREAATPVHRVIESPRGIVLQVDFPSPEGARAGTGEPARRGSKRLPQAPDPAAEE